MALWSGGVYVAAILFLTMTSYPTEASPGHVVCYYSSWAHYRQGLAKYTVEDIPVELCTHLIYAFATLDNKTFLAKPFDPWLDIELKNYEKFVQLKKKNPKMKVLVGLGGWNDSRSTKYSQMVADSNKRKTFAEEVVKFLLQHGFDGLDLDWEYPAYESRQEDKQGFTYWVEELKTALSPHGLLLTAAVSAGRYNIDRGYDIPKVSKHLDLINIMTYDFHGSWEQVVAHHSPLYPEVGQNPEFCTDFAINYWIKKGAPPHKLVMGVPLYGRSWTLAGSANHPGAAAAGPGKRGKYVKETGHLAYYECCLAHQKDGWDKVIGDGGPYLTKDDQWVGYDDIDAVTKKAEYALSKGLGGVMVWDTVSDDFNNACGHGTNPLLTAIARTLQGKGLLFISRFHENPTAPPSEPAPGITLTNVKVWRGGNSWKPQSGQGNTTLRGGDNSFGGTIKVKGSSTFGSGSAQTTKPPYVWMAWPIFNKSPEDTQHSISSSVGGTSSIVTPTSPSISSIRGGNTIGVTTDVKESSTFGSGSAQMINVKESSTFGSGSAQTINVKESSTFGSGSAQTIKPPYKWLSWPIFSKSPEDTQHSISFSAPGTSSIVTPTSPSISSIRGGNTIGVITDVKGSSTFGSGSAAFGSGSATFGSGSAQTIKPPYKWLSWPIFSQSADGTQYSISSHSTSSSATPTSPSISSSSHNFSSSSSSQFPSSLSALTWFADCLSVGFAPDPASCAGFYRCTNNHAYRFTCPGGLLWHQDQNACDWPDAVQCILPLSKPNIQAFHPPECPFF